MLDDMSLSELDAGSITQAAPVKIPRDRDLQRAEGFVRLVLSGSENGTRIVDVFQQSPIRIIFPRIRGAGIEEAVLVNTAGGIAGGDRLESVVTALAGASRISRLEKVRMKSQASSSRRADWQIG
jgi:urease accessory protein UreH